MALDTTNTTAGTTATPVAATPTQTTFGAYNVPASEIQAFAQQNLGNPAAIAQAAQQYGLSQAALAAATGLDSGIVSGYFQNAGVQDWTPQTTSTTPNTTTQVTPSQYQQNINNYFDALGKTNVSDAEFALRALQDAKANGIDINSALTSVPSDVATRFKTGTNEAITKGIAGILSDSNVSLDEVLNAQKALRDYGLTPEQAAQFSPNTASFVNAIPAASQQGLASVVGNLISSSAPEADRAKSLLGLEQKYGLTDAEIAQATGGKFTEQNVKDYFAPVRNFGTDVNALLADPSATPDQVQAKLAELSKNPLVASLYGDKISALNTYMASLPEKWSTAGATHDNVQINPIVGDRLYNQLDSLHQGVQNSMGKDYWSGTGFGSTEENTKAFANSLARAGVTDLKQLAVQDIPQTEKAQYVYNNGVWTRTEERGEAGGTASFPVTEAEAAKLSSVKPSEGVTVTLDRDLGTKQALVNKDTGQIISQDGANGLFKVGTTYAGEGATTFNIAMRTVTDPTTGETKTVPVPVAQYQQTGDKGLISAALAAASFVPGVAPFAMAANAGLAASQGNWLGAIASGLGAAPGISSALGAPLSASTTSALGTAATSAQVANALSQGNYLGAITGAGNLVGANGWTVPGTEGVIGADGLQLGELGKGIAALGALSQGQTLAGLLAGADLAGVKDIMGTGIAPKDIASVANVTKALSSNNPAAIIQTLGKTGQNYGVIPKAAAGGLASLIG